MIITFASLHIHIEVAMRKPTVRRLHPAHLHLDARYIDINICYIYTFTKYAYMYMGHLISSATSQIYLNEKWIKEKKEEI